MALAGLSARTGLAQERNEGPSPEVVPIPVEPLGVPPVVPTASIGQEPTSDSVAASESSGSASVAPAAASSAASSATSNRASVPPEGYPGHLLQLPPSADSALVFDLPKYRLHVFEHEGEQAVRRGDYFVAVGKQGIDKQREGDEKTPIGIYFISSYIPGDKLPAIYGVGAYPLNYPNPWDLRRGRTGSGIWIHGTDKDDESLLPESSRGCLTLRNDDFDSMAELARIRHTPVILSDAVSWTEPAQLEADRASLAAAVETWRVDWESLDTEKYLRHYAADFRTNSMSRRAWVAHKRRVNRYKSFIRVGLEEIGIYAYPGEPGLYLVTFEQSYRSD
ncbi:MAG: L,D-transpeptidase family protein, partial [Acidobacteriota bacterium]